MKIRKKIFVVLLMLCMVFQMLPNPVFADTISDNGIIYNGPTRICPNCDFTFSCTTSHRDENGAITPAITISVPNDDGFMQPYKINGSVVNDIYSAIVSKDIYSESTYFSVGISFRGELNGQFYWFNINTIYISVGHIDDNFDHMCDDCGEKISDHIDNDRDHYCDTCKVKTSCSGGTATCNAPAICEICNQPYGDVNPTNHAGGIESCNAEPATCTKDGYEAYWECKNCGHLFSDEAGTVQITEPVKIAASDHKDANKDHSCDVCGEEVGEHIDADHDHKCDYGCLEKIGKHEDANLDHKCDYGCSEKIGKHEDADLDHKCDYGCEEAIGEHVDADKDHKCDYGCAETIGKHEDADHDHKCDYGCTETIGDHTAGEGKHTCDYCGKVASECTGGTATCNAPAICEVCGNPYGEKDLTNHVGGTEIRDAKKATCTEDGYEGDTYCKGCETKLSSGEPIAASGHKDANKDHSCDVCDAKVGEHKAGEGKHTCDYCGKVASECSGGTATCKDKAICEICGKPYGDKDPNNHAGGEIVRNVKKANCTENGYTGDTYCKSCNTKLSSGEPIAASGHKDANKDHSCDVCGEVMSECSGGTATCKDKAICKVCGKPYGKLDPTNHVGGTEIRDAKEATCTEDGYEGDTYCKGCETKLSSGKTLSALGHKDANKDHSCDVCGEEVGDHKAGERKHTCDYCGEVMSECSGGTATCKDKAICEICGEAYGEVDPTNHVGDTEIRDVKAATCTEDGYTGDTYCKSCNTKLSSGEPIAAFGHKDANKDHNCDVCGEEVGEHIDADHDHKCDYGCAVAIGKHEDADHDHKCDYGCSVAIGEHKAGEGKHTCDYCGEVMSKCSGGTATCKDKAICEICGKPYGEVDPTNHVGGTEIRDAKAATCTEDGYEGDIYCKGCETKLSSGKAIVATGHTYKDEVTKEATTTSTGIRTYTCEKCGDSYTEEIAKLPTKTEPTKPSKPENREEPTKPGKSENRVEPSKENKPAPQVQSSKPTEPQKQIEPPKTVNQQSLIEIMIAMVVNGIAVPSVKLVTSLWQLILQFIKMILAAAF